MDKTKSYLLKLDARVREKNPLCVKSVCLGTKRVRLECHSSEFIPLFEKQLEYTLKDETKDFDARLVIWKEPDLKKLTELFYDSPLRARIEKLVSKQNWVNIGVNGTDGSFVCIFPQDGVGKAFDAETNTYYYFAENLDPEEFIKQGHIFVYMFNKIIKSPTAGLVHGAAVGLDGQGVLFCARGQRGKSTLAVLAMMSGFEYVSDDYLILEKEGSELLASPIYSIITLSPRMWNELYDDFKGKFVSNNARKDKYVFNISAYHDTFRSRYPIKVCVFPEIVNDAKPSIVPCAKGRAITQLIHSTINQTGDQHDIATVRKLIDFVKDFEFYQINLSPDIHANVECLREFCKSLKKEEKRNG